MLDGETARMGAHETRDNDFKTSLSHHMEREAPRLAVAPQTQTQPTFGSCATLVVWH